MSIFLLFFKPLLDMCCAVMSQAMKRSYAPFV